MKNKKAFTIKMIVFFSAAAYFFYILVAQQHVLDMRKNELVKVENEIKKQINLNNELNNKLNNINSDEYIEKVAREKLGMVKEGEKIFFDIGR